MACRNYQSLPLHKTPKGISGLNPQGLNKYDGEKFTVYKHDNDDPHSLSDNHITCLLPDDANEGLWVGTNNGLNYINLKTNQITKYQTDD